MKGKREGETIVIPTVYNFNGKTKELEKALNDPSMIKAYSLLLKKMGGKPSEMADTLRDRVWKGKNPRDILAELEKG